MTFGTAVYSHCYSSFGFTCFLLRLIHPHRQIAHPWTLPQLIPKCYPHSLPVIFLSLSFFYPLTPFTFSTLPTLLASRPPTIPVSIYSVSLIPLFTFILLLFAFIIPPTLAIFSSLLHFYDSLQSASLALTYPCPDLLSWLWQTD